MENLGQYQSMEMDDDDQLDLAQKFGVSNPQYPPGLRISLVSCCLDKLGLDDMPAVGDLLHFAAMARVTSTSDGEMGKRVELQIELMTCFENESEEDGDNE